MLFPCNVDPKQLFTNYAYILIIIRSGVEGIIKIKWRNYQTMQSRYTVQGIYGDQLGIQRNHKHIWGNCIRTMTHFICNSQTLCGIYHHRLHPVTIFLHSLTINLFIEIHYIYYGLCQRIIVDKILIFFFSFSKSLIIRVNF